jgi:hypothetical protein
MKDDEFITKLRAAYEPEAVNPIRFDAQLEERIAERPRRNWLWGLGGVAVAAAIALFVWTRPAASPGEPVVPSAPAIASSPSTASPDSDGEEWVVALNYDDDLGDDLGGLPDDYAELADMLEL